MSSYDIDNLALNLRSGNEATYVSLFNIYFPRLCQFAGVYIPDRSAVKDIVQNVFIKLWENRQELRENTSIPAYLLTITKNSCLDYLKHQQIEIKYQQAVIQKHAETELNYNALKRLDIDLLDYNEINRIIEQTIEQLPPQCRQVFRLSRYSHLSNAEIAGKLDISQKAVEANITRALKVFRLELKDYISILLVLNIPIH